MADITLLSNHSTYQGPVSTSKALSPLTSRENIIDNAPIGYTKAIQAAFDELQKTIAELQKTKEQLLAVQKDNHRLLVEVQTQDGIIELNLSETDKLNAELEEVKAELEETKRELFATKNELNKTNAQLRSAPKLD